jgi:hypothetical protein
MRLRIDRASDGRAAALRALLAVTATLALWPACSPPHQSSTDSTVSSAGQGGGTNWASNAGHSGAACAQPGSCGGSDQINLVVGGGEKSYGGGGAGGGNGLCQPPALVTAGCVPASANGTESQCNGVDDDCDGSVDEGCACSAGDVQPCFLGAPGNRGIGACADGTQTCMRGVEFAPYWGECMGGIRPSAEKCDGLDNDCNGCADDLDGCKPQWTCPGPNDPRTPAGTPLSPYLLRGRDFYSNPVLTWSWTVQGGPCDTLVPNSPSFTLTGADSETATFTPKLSGDYRITMTVTPLNGATFTCTWIVHIVGPGLRIEMCYPESSLYDLDLYVKQPGHKTPWFTATAQYSSALDQCSWANCEAILRGSAITPPPMQEVTRANWGYANSALSLCQNTLQGTIWQNLGYCASPRLDIDNNLDEATGVPENINVDAPKDNETFRIMVANFSGQLSHPMVNVYCDGRRAATIGAAPDDLQNFTGTSGSAAIGALWRVADVTTRVSGTQTTCTVNVLHPPGSSTGFDVTFNDPRY